LFIANNRKIIKETKLNKGKVVEEKDLNIVRPCAFEWLLEEELDRQIYRFIKQEIK
jgi:hypothetical protein